ncbi:ActR/PrrA/RegA family redox response regulator transcription factor [Rhabdaerophilum sp. SD176]|uniref:ActR/PrrA/RegA family redox response regulator transcription factor n=1 Tax=Rhabdaerophilum sp. SD176 TaxID=2983548 RepID=UPI0024E0254D|nr:ActR/PrrA/RegA family redox response regulator transcription factor [Rhabdaerophilum sp. SD176]
MAAAGRRTLVIVDNDRLAVSRLLRGLEPRGFDVEVIESIGEAIAVISRNAPDCLVVESRLPDGNGLDVIVALKRHRPDARAVVLTGYGNIATAVAAIKRGAADYLPKPADIEDVFAVLVGEERVRVAVPENPMSADRVRWEHIQRIFELCDRNVSETARRLNMHRRTLQRILAKRAPR